MELPLPRRPLNDAERRAAVSLARAVLPETETFAGADETTVRIAEEFLTSLMPESVPAWGAGQRAILASARLLSGGRSFESLSSTEAEDVLTRLASKPVIGNLIGSLSSLYKMAHFDRLDTRGALRHKLSVLDRIEEPRWLEQIQRAEDFDEDELECDVVVIGTGAGGAVVGRHLADQGLAVVFVEEGEHYRRNDFKGNFSWTVQNLYRNVISIGNASLLIPQGRLVGGSTAVNGGSSFRPPRWVTDRWCEELGTDEFSSDALEPYFERTETILQVEKADAGAAGPIHGLIAEGAHKLGWHHDLIRRNAPGCRGEGFCDHGCRTDARRSTNLSYIPPALERGSFLLTGLRADKLLLEGGRAVGVEGLALDRDRNAVTAKNGSQKRVRVKGRAVILAGGAFASPLFLLAQGLANSSDQVGRNLTVHPSGPAMALFDEPVFGANHIPQADYSLEFLKEGLLLLSALPDPHVVGPIIPYVGHRLMEILSKHENIGGFGFLARDHSTGRVRIGPNGRTLLTYNLTPEDVALCHRGQALSIELLLAAGAREVYPGLLRPMTIRDQAGLARFRETKFSAGDFFLTSYHPLGSCRMSRNPKDGVVDLNHQSHDIPGLFIVDGSTVRGPLGVNPQITIMGLATRAAEKIGPLLDA